MNPARDFLFAINNYFCCYNKSYQTFKMLLFELKKEQVFSR